MTELPDEITEDVDAATVTDAGNMKPGSVSESLEVVNKLLEDIDQDLKIHLNNDNPCPEHQERVPVILRPGVHFKTSSGLCVL